MLTLLLACVLSASYSDPMAAYRGQPVLSIEIEAPEEEEIEDLRHLIDIQPGFLLSAANLQASIKRLYALGRFSNVRVAARRLSGVVMLTFYLQPLRRLENIDTDGANRVDEDALLEALHLRPGDEVDRRTASVLEEKTLTWMDAAGFAEAQCHVVESSDSPSRASFTLEIHEGHPRRIKSIEFTGSHRAPSIALRRIVRARRGDILNRHTLDADRDRLERTYVDRGFLKVTVAPADVSVETNASHAHTVTFNIEAGPRFPFHFSGNQYQSTETLRSLWPESDGRLREDTLDIWRARIQQHYRALGFDAVRVHIRRQHDAATNTTHHIIAVTEGTPLRVRSIKFVGAHTISPSALANQIRAVLTENLSETHPFQRMVTGEAEPRPCCWGSSRTPAAMFQSIPAEDRWSEGLYQSAIDDIVAIYRDRGFLSVQVAAPELIPLDARDGGDGGDAEHMELAPHAHDVKVRIAIEEGKQTFVRSIRFRDNETSTAGELLSELEQNTGVGESARQVALGAAYSPNGAEDGRIALVRRYRDRGYLYARVFRETELSEDSNQADIIYRVEEGPQVRIRNVLVRGNRHTRDSIINSRITMRQGDIYRLEQAVRDQRSIAGLGVFSSVRVKLIDEERPEEQKDLVAEVKERNRQPVEISPGLSTADGPRLKATYTHLNIFGSASSLLASARLNRQLFFGLYGDFSDSMQLRYDSYSGADKVTKAVERDIRLGVRSPRLSLLPLDPLLRIDLIEERENAIPYSVQSLSLVAGIDLFPTGRVRLAIEPEISWTNLDCPPVAPTGIQLDISQSSERCLNALAEQDARLFEEGERRAFQFSPSITIDGRDNPFNPRSGYFATAVGNYTAGKRQTPVDDTFVPFSFTKLEGSIAGYVPVSSAVLVAKVAAGTIHVLTGQSAPIDERFFLGGRDTLRGFVERTLVPADSCIGTLSDQPVRAGCSETLEQLTDEEGRPLPVLTRGGNHFVLAKAELRMPISDNFSVDFFVDAGNLWVASPAATRASLRFGTGVGLRYNTPVGALVLDVGVNPSPREELSEPSDPQRHFSVGSF